MLADYSGIILGKKIGNENENNTCNVGACRYGISLRACVQLDISRVNAENASEILSWTRARREIPYLQAVTYYFVYYVNVLLTIFRRFPSTFRKFPKILQKLSEGQRNVSEHFPKIPEDNRRFLAKNR